MKHEIYKQETYLVLHNVRSVHNVGSIFRTADAAGVVRIYLCGYTPAPIDRFGRKRDDFAKVSLGAEGCVRWEQCGDTMECITALRREGVFVVAVEQKQGSIDYRAIPDCFPRAFVFGNETEGISDELCSCCDAVAEIPVRGRKESLNVSVAAGVVLFSAAFVFDDMQKSE